MLKIEITRYLIPTTYRQKTYVFLNFKTQVTEQKNCGFFFNSPQRQETPPENLNCFKGWLLAGPARGNSSHLPQIEQHLSAQCTAALHTEVVCHLPSRHA